MTKKAAAKLASELAHRNIGQVYCVIRLTYEDGSRTYHVSSDPHAGERLRLRCAARKARLLGGILAKKFLVITPKEQS